MKLNLYTIGKRIEAIGRAIAEIARGRSGGRKPEPEPTKPAPKPKTDLPFKVDDVVQFKRDCFFGKIEAGDTAAKAQTPAPAPHLRGGHLRAAGIGRDPENDRVVFLSLNRVSSDDELRAIHSAISRTPATCPFCAKPTYVLPCSHCGEPDVPDQF